MRAQESGKLIGCDPMSFQDELGQESSFAVIVLQQDAHSKYQEVWAQAQVDFLAYRQAGGELDALRWMYHFRPELFNLWVSCNSRGGHHDTRPFGRTRQDGARMVRGW